VPAEGQGHHERPRAPQAALVGIEEVARRAEVDLRLRAGLGLDPDGRPRRGRRQPPQEPLHRGVAPGEAVLLDEELENGLALHASLPPGDHLVPEGGDSGLVHRGRARRRREQGGQCAGIGQVAGEQAAPLRPHLIARHRVAAHAQLARDPARRLPEPEPPEDFAYIGHLAPPSSHRAPPG
jgi:hypothetical protein